VKIIFCIVLIRLEVSEYVTEQGIPLCGLEQVTVSHVQRGAACRGKSWGWRLADVKCFTWDQVTFVSINQWECVNEK
jgi:hypothetical protein